MDISAPPMTGHVLRSHRRGSANVELEPSEELHVTVSNGSVSTGSVVCQTRPRQLDAEFYARILQSSNPEAEFSVPVREEWLHYSQLEPGHMFLINRSGWATADFRSSQTRGRSREDRLINGGWNR